MPQRLVLINGLPGSGKTTLAGQIGERAGWAMISKDAIKEAVATGLQLPTEATRLLGAAAMEMAWSLAADVPGTVVVESWWFPPRDTGHALHGIERVNADQVLEIWCEVPPELALARYQCRRRHAIHQDSSRLDSDWPDWADRGGPLALTPVLHVDTSRPVDVAEVLGKIHG